MKRGATNVQKITKSWRKESKKLDRVLDWLNLDHIVVRYEDFCHSPNQVIRKILESCDTDTDHALLDVNTILDISKHHVIPGSSILSQQVLTPKLDESWRHTLDKSELQVFSKYGQSLNEKYGYTSS